MNSEETRKAMGKVIPQDVATFRHHVFRALQQLDAAYNSLSHGTDSSSEAMCSEVADSSAVLRAIVRRIDEGVI